MMHGLIARAVRLWAGCPHPAGSLSGVRAPRPHLGKIHSGLAAALVVIGFGAARLAAVELDIPVFAGGYGLSFYEETARKFEALRPGVKVHLYGDPRIGDKIAVRAIAGNYPDAALAAYVPWPQLARAGKVLDLAQYLDGPNWENDARWRDTFLPGSLDTWRIDGRVYGLPFSYACWTIFYNRAMFRQHGWTEPRTWDEFFELCDRIKAAGIAPVSLTGTHGLYPDAFLRAAYYNLAGPDAWRALQDLAPGARNDPRYIRAAAVLQRITQNYALRGWDGASHTGAQLAFLEGRAAMTVSGSWMVNEMEGKIPADFEMGAMNFPVFPDGVAEPSAIQAQSDCFFLFLNSDPEREKQAVDFLRFLTSRERAQAFVRAANSPVSVRGVPRSAFSPQMQDTVAMIERAKEAFNMPQVMLQPHAVRQALTDGRVELMTGAITPQQFGDQLESAAANDRGARGESRARGVQSSGGRHGAVGGAGGDRRLASLASEIGDATPRSHRRRPGGRRSSGGSISLRTAPCARCARFCRAGLRALRGAGAAAGTRGVCVGVHALGWTRPAQLGRLV